MRKRRRISRALPPGILPAIIHQLNAASKGLGNLKVRKGHPDQSEVTEIYKDEEVRRHVVYLNQLACTCREWQVTGKPYPHALTIITTTRQPNMHQFVLNNFSVERFQTASKESSLILLIEISGLRCRRDSICIPQLAIKEVQGGRRKTESNQQVREVGKPPDK